MDDFNVSRDYNPEDEYAPIEEPVTEPAEEILEEPAEEQLSSGQESAEPQPFEQPAAAARQPYPAPYPPAPVPPVYGGYAPPQFYGYMPPSYPPQQGYPPYPYPQYYYPPMPPQQMMPPQAPPQPLPPKQEPANRVQPGQPRPDTPKTDNPYPAAYSQPEPPVKTPTPTGTKVFIIILCTLLAAMTIGFIVYIANIPKDKDKNNDSNGFTIEDGGKDDNGFGFGTDPYSYDSDSYKEIEDEITLIEDKGETQKHDEDKEESVGKPDENVSNIKLEKLPADKDDKKYTTQSAYDSVCDSVVTVMCYEDKITDNERDIISQGTGTVISSDGYIITNAHVIGNSKVYAINIVLNNSKSYQAKVIGFDTWTDLAVLKIDAKDLKAVTFGDSELINIGDEVIAIGSPGGVKFQNSLTKGIVSAVDRELSINKYVRYIQSDAAISPGNSGGPLCNIYGQVIGITTAKTVATNYENMSFSIPSATVEEIVGDLIHYGYVKGRSRIGFSGTEITREEAFYYNCPQGVVINIIDDSGALAGTDIKEGDILVELDGEEITSFQDIYDVLADHKPDDKISFKVIRYED